MSNRHRGDGAIDVKDAAEAVGSCNQGVGPGSDRYPFEEVAFRIDGDQSIEIAPTQQIIIADRHTTPHALCRGENQVRHKVCAQH